MYLAEAVVQGGEEPPAVGGSDDPADLAAVGEPTVLDGQHAVLGLARLEQFGD